MEPKAKETLTRALWEKSVGANAGTTGGNDTHTTIVGGETPQD